MEEDNKNSQWRKDAEEDNAPVETVAENDSAALKKNNVVAGEENAQNVPPNYWKWASVLALLVIAALIITLVMKPVGSSEALAEVNGVKITKDDMYKALYAQGGAQTLDSMITEELVKQGIAKENISVPDKDVDKMLADIKKNIPTEADFQKALAQQGMTEPQLMERLKTQLQLKKLFADKIKITDEEAKAFFDAPENQAQFAAKPEQIKASHILVPTQEEADAIIAQLKSGADFAALAKEKGTDATKDTGGDLGPAFGRDAQMDQDFLNAAFALKEGEISKAVKTQFGYHVIKVTEKIPATIVTFEAKKEEIKSQLADTKLGTLIQPWIEELRAKADIKTPEPKTTATPAPSTVPAATAAPAAK